MHFSEAVAAFEIQLQANQRSRPMPIQRAMTRRA
jgi:hypothetical protein